MTKSNMTSLSFPLKIQLRTGADSQKLFATLCSNRRVGRAELGHALVELERDGVDVAACFETERLERDGFNFFVACSAVSYWLSKTSADWLAVSNTVDNLIDLYGNDGAVASMYSGWRNYVDQRGEHLADIISEGANALSLVNFRALSQYDLHIFAELVQEWLNSGDLPKIRAAIAASGATEVSDAKVLKQMEAMLVEHCKAGLEDELHFNAIQSILQLSVKQIPTIESLNLLKQLLSEGGASGRYAAYREMWQTSAKFPREVVNAVLGTIRNIGKDEAGCVKELDHWLYGLDADGDKELIISILRGIVKSNGANLSDLESFIHKLNSDAPHLSARLAIDFVMDDDFIVASQSKALLDRMDESLIEVDIKHVEARDLDFLLSRVMGHFIFDRGLAVSIMSRIITRSRGDERSQHVGRIVGFWFRNYAGDIELFEKARKAGFLSRAGWNELRSTATPFLQRFDKLEIVSAFEVPIENRITQRNLRLERSREVARQVDRGSILASMFTKKHLLHGNESIFSVHPGGGAAPKRQVTPMSTIQHSIVLPRLSVIAPQYFDFLIRRLRGVDRLQDTLS